MGFYIKKSFNIGPIRFNFSKSGIGLSIGTKGLRIGSGPNGNYIHGGRHGIYYKKNLSSQWTIFIICFAVIVILVLYLIKSEIITINI